MDVFVREAECHNESKTWKWLRKGGLKKGTESLLCAAQEQVIRTNSVNYSNDSLLCTAQEQAIRTNSVNYSNDKNNETPRCRLALQRKC